VGNRPKLQDVADLAGVSIGTASYALNNKSVVSPETRERVLQAARQLGYQLPARLSPLPSEKSLTTIGVLVKRHLGQSIPIDPFYSAVLSGAEQECKRYGLNLLYSSIAVDDLSNLIEWPTLFKDQQIDGWLLLGAFVPETMDQLAAYLDSYVVLIDAYVAAPLTYDTIVADNVSGAYEAVSYLIKQGHQHIGLIGSTFNSYPSILMRREGYLRALKDHNIKSVYIEDSPLHSRCAYPATQTLLKRAPQITAIFACNDDTALAAMRAAHDMGYKIPDDLSVIGFDDQKMSAEIIPPLTTIYVDKMLMGVLGVRQLIDRRQNPERIPLTITMGTRLIVRQSVRALTYKEIEPLPT
jgi:LacI family transcriptional regulator